MQHKIIPKSQDNFLLAWCDMLGQDGDYIVRQPVPLAIVKLVEVGSITGDGGKGKERPAILGAGEDGEVGRLLKNHQHIKKFLKITCKPTN